VRTAALVMIVLFVSLPAFAADFSGRWTGTVNTAKGDYPIAFTFQVSDAKVTGTMLGTDGTSFKIEDGKIDGDTLTFNVSLNYPGKQLSRVYKGKLSGDEIKFTVDQSGQVSEFAVKRAK
jgi:hypothetical protein